ncbi:MAG: DODA-type extradiol aromatic ring-opening family dioxygenase [Acidimicrobiia bacterium]|jgi:aromatic ring-opening dioxygenase catalytic subunit (LigB family)
MNDPAPIDPPPLPSVFIPHGGGPCFFMDWTMGPPDTWDRLAQFLRSFSDRLAVRPDAIVVISGHHEGEVVEVSTAETPSLLFDYYGFPAHTYELRYPAPGSPALGRRIGELLADASILHRLDSQRGFDHGVFVPLLLMYPDADIPVVQVSLRSDLDPGFHLDLGETLAPLRREGTLILGSGLSYHNMAAFMTPQAADSSSIFDSWLTSACQAPPQQRRQLLTDWDMAPAARLAHPREEHLLPLMVTAGAGGDDHGRRVFVDQAMGATISAYAFGEFTSALADVERL